jgi:hypothetical protein
MGRKKKLTYETRTPALQDLACNSAPPLRVHSWFDHERNIMVVEVSSGNPSETAVHHGDPGASDTRTFPTRNAA